MCYEALESRSYSDVLPGLVGESPGGYQEILMKIMSASQLALGSPFSRQGYTRPNTGMLPTFDFFVFNSIYPLYTLGDPTSNERISEDRHQTSLGVDKWD